MRGTLYYFTSDILYLPTLYKDLFIDKFSLSGWSLTPSPYFFPDMGIFFILMYITKNYVVSFFLFAVFQGILLTFGLYFTFTNILEENKIHTMICAIIIITGAMLYVILAHNICFEALLYILMPTIHTGAFAIALISLGLVITKEDTKKNNIILFLLCFLTTLSDKIFLVIFVIPILVTICVLYFSHIVRINLLIKRGVILIISTLTALITFNYIKHNFVKIPKPSPLPNIQKIITSFNAFYKDMSYFLGNNHYYVIMWFVWLAITVGLIVYYTKYAENVRLLIFTVFSLCASLFILAACILRGLYIDINSFRYITGAFIIPFFGLSIYFSYYMCKFLGKTWKNFILTSVILCLGMLCIKLDTSIPKAK